MCRIAEQTISEKDITKDTTKNTGITLSFHLHFLRETMRGGNLQSVSGESKVYPGATLQKMWETYRIPGSRILL